MKKLVLMLVLFSSFQQGQMSQDYCSVVSGAIAFKVGFVACLAIGAYSGLLSMCKNHDANSAIPMMLLSGGIAGLVSGCTIYNLSNCSCNYLFAK